MTQESYHHFYVGQEVVCIRSDFDPKQKTTRPTELVEGQIYVIRWVGPYNHYLDGEYIGVRLQDIVRGKCPYWGYEDQPFYADRFRPLVKDPIAIFRRIATDPSYKVDGPEGPLHGKPDDGERVKEKEKEGV